MILAGDLCSVGRAVAAGIFRPDGGGLSKAQDEFVQRPLRHRELIDESAESGGDRLLSLGIARRV